MSNGRTENELAVQWWGRERLQAATSGQRRSVVAVIVDECEQPYDSGKWFWCRTQWQMFGDLTTGGSDEY